MCLNCMARACPGPAFGPSKAAFTWAGGAALGSLMLATAGAYPALLWPACILYASGQAVAILALVAGGASFTPRPDWTWIDVLTVVINSWVGVAMWRGERRRGCDDLALLRQHAAQWRARRRQVLWAAALGAVVLALLFCWRAALAGAIR